MNDVLRFVPPWVRDVPEGLHPTFYATLSRDGDLGVKAQVDKARAALAAYRAQESTQ